MTEINCPKCYLAMPLIPDLIGRTVICPECKTRFTMADRTIPPIAAPPSYASPPPWSNRNPIPMPSQAAPQMIPSVTVHNYNPHYRQISSVGWFGRAFGSSFGIMLGIFAFFAMCFVLMIVGCGVLAGIGEAARQRHESEYRTR